MDFSIPVVVKRHSYLPICSIWIWPRDKNLSNQAALGPDFVEPISLIPLDGFIPIKVLWKSARPVVVQHHGHLTLTLDFQGQILKILYLRNGRPDWHGTKRMWVDRMLDSHCDFWTLTSAMTLTLDCHGQVLKYLYLRNGRADLHGTKEIWVDRVLYLLCDLELWLWPWILKVKFLKSSFIRIRGWIDMEPNECESLGCWTQVVTWSFDITHDLDLGFFNSHILGMAMLMVLEWKRCELDTMLDEQCYWTTVHGK